MKSFSLKCFILAAVLASAAAAASAQGILSGSVEATAKFGYSNLEGVDNKDHVNFGFGAAYNINKEVAVGFDYDYLPLGKLQTGISDGPDSYVITANEHLQLFGGTARFSLLKDRFAVPYVVVGGGGIALEANATIQDYDYTYGSVSESGSATQHGGYFGGGGGVSLFLTHHIGVRPEFRYERLQFQSTSYQGFEVNGGGKNDARETISVFYQFGGRA